MACFLSWFSKLCVSLLFLSLPSIEDGWSLTGFSLSNSFCHRTFHRWKKKNPSRFHWAASNSATSSAAPWGTTAAPHPTAGALAPATALATEAASHLGSTALSALGGKSFRNSLVATVFAVFLLVCWHMLLHGFDVVWTLVKSAISWGCWLCMGIALGDHQLWKQKSLWAAQFCFSLVVLRGIYFLRASGSFRAMASLYRLMKLSTVCTCFLRFSACPECTSHRSYVVYLTSMASFSSQERRRKVSSNFIGLGTNPSSASAWLTFAIKIILWELVWGWSKTIVDGSCLLVQI